MINEYWLIRDAKDRESYFSESTAGTSFGDKVLATRYGSREAALDTVSDLWCDDPYRVKLVRVRKVKRKPVPGMRITITREQLVDLGACEPGLKWFDSIAPNGVWSSEWTPLHDVWIRKSEWCGWLLDKKLIPIANFYEANLRVADLYRADLGGANLQGAYLQGVDLRWANLRGANLYRADLEGANLYMADLQGAYLQGADLGDWERGPDGLARRKT